jgi:hypothetical protein
VLARVSAVHLQLNWANAPINIESSEYGYMPKDGDQWNAIQHINTRATPRM